MILYDEGLDFNLFSDSEESDFINYLQEFAPASRWLVYLASKLAKCESKTFLIKNVYSSQDIELPETVYFQTQSEDLSPAGLAISFSATRKYKKRALMNAYLWNIAEVERDLMALTGGEIVSLKDSSKYNVLDNMLKGTSLFQSNGAKSQSKVAIEMARVLEFLEEKKVEIKSLVSVSSGRQSEESFYQICTLAYLSFELTQITDMNKVRETEHLIEKIKKDQIDCVFSKDLLLSSLILGNFIVAIKSLPAFDERELNDLIDGCDRIQKLMESSSPALDFVKAGQFSNLEIEKFKTLCEKAKLSLIILEPTSIMMGFEATRNKI